MKDRMSELCAALAKTKTMRQHAEECNRAISKQAGDWMQGAENQYRDMAASEAEALDPRYNGVGALNMARGLGILRKLRDGE